MKFDRGDLIQRGDTETFAVVVSNSLWNAAGGWVILCAVIATPPDDQHPASVDIGGGMVALPGHLTSIPRSAVVKVLRSVDSASLNDITRILRNATGP